jgi:hypothetical protein
MWRVKGGERRVKGGVLAPRRVWICGVARLMKVFLLLLTTICFSSRERVSDYRDKTRGGELDRL